MTTTRTPDLIAAHRLVSAVLIAAVVVLAGCDLTRSPTPTTQLTIYGRTIGAPDAWVAVVPLANPPLAVGFGRDIGVACFDAPIGSQVVLTDRNPAAGATAIQLIAEIGPPAGGQRSLWVDITADGTVSSGDGVPAWWSGPAACL